MRVKPKSRPRRRAFTLLEVLMVIVILGILAALVVPNLIGTREGAMIDTTKIKIKSMGTSLDTFNLHCGRYPTTDEGLNALLDKPDDDEIAERWRGPYLKEAPKDAWGHTLNYESPGTYNETSYDLSSAGSNGQPGDEDDLTNWEQT